MEVAGFRQRISALVRMNRIHHHGPRWPKNHVAIGERIGYPAQLAGFRKIQRVIGDAIHHLVFQGYAPAVICMAVRILNDLLDALLQPRRVIHLRNDLP